MPYPGCRHDVWKEDLILVEALFDMNTTYLKLIFLCRFLIFLGKYSRNSFSPELESVLKIILHDGQFAVDPEDTWR